MSEKKASRPNSKWATGKRRDLDDSQAKKAGYPGDLREDRGWFRGAKVFPRKT